MGLLDDQIIINENLLKAVKDLMGSMEQAHKCMTLLTERIRKLEDRVYPKVDPRLTGPEFSPRGQ